MAFTSSFKSTGWRDKRGGGTIRSTLGFGLRSPLKFFFSFFVIGYRRSEDAGRKGRGVETKSNNIPPTFYLSYNVVLINKVISS